MVLLYGIASKNGRFGIGIANSIGSLGDGIWEQDLGLGIRNSI